MSDESRQTFTRTNNSREKRLVDAILVAAVGALCWILYTLNQSINTLQAIVQTQQAVVAMHDKQIDRLQIRQDSLEGKITRGGPDALNQQ
jgi:type II secretory pathway component PulC